MKVINKLSYFLISIYIIVLPIAPSKLKFHGLPLNGDGILGVVLLVFLIKTLFLKTKRKMFLYQTKDFLREPLTWFLLMMFGMMLFSASYAASKTSAIGEGVRFFTYIALYFIVKYDIEDEGDKKRIILLYFAVSVVISIIGVEQHFTGWGLIAHDPNSSLKGITSTLENPNILGAYLLLPIFPLIMLMFGEKRNSHRVLYILSILIILSNVYLSFSRNAWLGLAIGCVIFALIYSWKFGAIFIILGGLSLFIPQVASRVKDIGSASQNLTRITIWKATLQMTKDKIFTGVGSGNFEKSYLEFIRKHKEFSILDEVPHPHNVLLKYFSDLGVVGLAAIIGILVTVLIKFRKIILNSPKIFFKPFYKGFFISILVFYFMNMIDNFFTAPKLIAFFWILIALGDSFNYQKHHNESAALES